MMTSKNKNSNSKKFKALLKTTLNEAARPKLPKTFKKSKSKHSDFLHFVFTRLQFEQLQRNRKHEL